MSWPVLRNSLISLAVGATVLLAAPAPSDATTMIYADLEQLTDLSDYVVHGVVVDQRVFYGDFGNISTQWTVAVEETWHGESHEIVQFTQFGGTLDDRTLYVPGDAQFELGEEVVVFLMGDEPTDLYLVAMGQSRYEVERTQPTLTPVAPEGIIQIDLGSMQPVGSDPLQSAPATVVRDLRGIGFYNPDLDGGTHLHLDEIEVLTLEGMRARVIDAVEQAGEGAQ